MNMDTKMKLFLARLKKTKVPYKLKGKKLLVKIASSIHLWHYKKEVERFKHAVTVNGGVFKHIKTLKNKDYVVKVFKATPYTIYLRFARKYDPEVDVKLTGKRASAR